MTSAWTFTSLPKRVITAIFKAHTIAIRTAGTTSMNKAWVKATALRFVGVERMKPIDHPPRETSRFGTVLHTNARGCYTRIQSDETRRASRRGLPPWVGPLCDALFR